MDLINFSAQSFREDAFGEPPFTILDPPIASELSFITQVALLENGAPEARKRWQQTQLKNLLKHARRKSSFWRRRLRLPNADVEDLRFIPALSRSELVLQCASEGSLIDEPNGTSSQSYATTGSTGQPVKVFVSPANGNYNSSRGLAHFFMNNVSLNANRVKIGPHFFDDERDILVTRSDEWDCNLARLFQTGSSKEIAFEKNEAALIDELSKEQVGYLSSPNRFIEILIRNGGADLIKKLGVKMWFHQSDYRDPELLHQLKACGVACTSSYSSGELGPIAFECSQFEGRYHVAHSNIIVEIDNSVNATYNGTLVGRLLVTSLNSYATPLIRYDVGDFATLESVCPCGHQGPTLSNIHGRRKGFLYYPDGTFRQFHVRGHELLRVLDFMDSRIIQTGADEIIIEICRREPVTQEDKIRIKEFVHRATNFPFKVEVIHVKAIDWSSNPKRLFFTSKVNF
jgi:phenylacetate-coenzyme A ligase PaaK-like adenylate-forming protein